MHSLNNRGVQGENLRIFPNCAQNKMDYRQKVVAPSSQKLKHDEDDDEDLETLRLAALKSLRAKPILQTNQQSSFPTQQVKPRVGYSSCSVYNQQRQAKRGYYQNRLQRQNWNTFYPSRVNQNLIEIVPVEEEETLGKDLPHSDLKNVKTDRPADDHNRGDSKFYRYKDDPSGSEEDDTKESNCATGEILPSLKSENLEKCGGDESGTEKDIQSGIEESPSELPINENVCENVEDEDPEDEEAEEEEEDDEEQEEDEEEEEKPANDDDDDVLLMADLEEEDSLERLMDEMEREMNVDKQEEKKEKKAIKKEPKESRKINEVPRVRNRKSRIERETDRNGTATGTISSSSLIASTKNERRSVSPRSTTRASQKRRSLSPKPRLRKKSPRRSPRRSSPPRLSKKSFREMPRMRSPRKLSPLSRFSPRPRSPKLSPRARSPSNRSPTSRRSPPMRKLSPRLRSPHSRSPRIRRSRSPRGISRSRSPPPPPPPPSSSSLRSLRSPKRANRSRSPRTVKSRSPRISPVRSSPRARTPRSKSPRSSPVRTSWPRSRSPRLSSPRRITSPRPRSPKQCSPDRRRVSPVRIASPARLSPRRSPWSSPRNSPRLSPRRRKSPKETVRRLRQRSLTPDETPNVAYKREIVVSPVRKTPASPDNSRTKGKQKDVIVGITANKETNDLVNDPIFEARRRKFESTKIIDPIHDNKKIKLCKRDNTCKTRVDLTEDIERIMEVPKLRKANKIIEEYDAPESDLCLTDDYVYEVMEDVASDESTAENTVSMCVEMVPMKVDKERSRKKKKRDKELYQVGKLKGELPLSERIGKEKKCKKRKDRGTSPAESSPERVNVVQDLTVDEEEADLRTELSRRRAERLNRAAPIQSARLLQSAFKGVVNEVAKTNAKVIQRHASKGDEKKNNKKEVRRVTVLHRTVTDMPDSEDETVIDSKVPIRFRLGLNKSSQESRESKSTRKSSKRQGRKVKHKNNMSLNDQERKN